VLEMFNSQEKTSRALYKAVHHELAAEPSCVYVMLMFVAQV
jgi:hypothetical protein